MKNIFFHFNSISKHAKILAADINMANKGARKKDVKNVLKQQNMQKYFVSFLQGYTLKT